MRKTVIVQIIINYDCNYHLKIINYKLEIKDSMFKGLKFQILYQIKFYFSNKNKNIY